MMADFQNFCQKEVLPLLHKNKGRYGLALLFNGQIFNYNGNLAFCAASTIKVPLLVLALKDLECDINMVIEKPLEKTGGSSLLEYLKDTSSLTLHDLLLFMIAISDNSATNAIIDLLGGFSSIEQGFINLGLNQTKLRRKMMDLTALKKGLDNTASPLEMVTLLSSLDNTTLAKVRYFLSKQLFNEGLGFFLNEGMVEHKTGSLYTVFNDVGLLKLGEDILYYAYYSKDINIGESIILAGNIGQTILRWYQDESN